MYILLKLLDEKIAKLRLSVFCGRTPSYRSLPFLPRCYHMPAATSFNWRGLLKEDLLANFVVTTRDKAERLIVETGRVFEDVIARTGAGAAWCIEDRKGHRKVIQLVFLHGPDAGAACCVEEFVSERGLSLAETARRENGEITPPCAALGAWSISSWTRGAHFAGHVLTPHKIRAERSSNGSCGGPPPVRN